MKLERYKRPVYKEMGYKYKNWYIVKTKHLGLPLKEKSTKWVLEKYGEPRQFFETLNDVKKHLVNLDKPIR